MKRHLDNNAISEDSTLKDVMHTLDNSPIGIVFFVNPDSRVLGIMTDGDVRRAVLDGASLSDPAQKFWVSNFVSGKAKELKKSNLRLLNDRIRHLPILDDDGRLFDFLSVNDSLWLPIMEPSLTGNELDYVQECINTNWISSQGAYVTKFEKSFSSYHSVPYALTTSSGTTALHLALTALGVGPGDEVIVPDLTFGASANSVIHCGAKPVFVDVDPRYWNIDPGLIEASLSKDTKAIMPVHLYGHPCDMDPILDVAQGHSLFIVEDCAEALGAEYKGRLVGTFGDVACFSFFSNKIITTGEGGMVITNATDLMEKMEVLRDHGMRKEKRYWHEVAGFNYRMTNLQAALGLAQMEQIQSFINNRREIAAMYSQQLANIEGIFLPPERQWAKNIYWLYSILIDEKRLGISRDKLILELQKEGVETRPMFYPLHIQPAFRSAEGSFPVTERLAATGLSLPSGGTVSIKKVKKISGYIKKIISNCKILDQRCEDA
jgi:perosamine synthetase